jgi:hypothetical protein
VTRQPGTIPPDRMKALERLHERLTQEYRDSLQVRTHNEAKLRQLEEEMDTVGMALDWARRMP